MATAVVCPRGRGFGVLWTTALMAAALAQAPGNIPATPARASGPVQVLEVQSETVTPAAYPEWLTYRPATDSRWGFDNFLPRIGVQHRSQGYGYDSGYTSFDTFVPLHQEDFSQLTAFQGSLLLDNYGDIGFVTGLVHRRYVDPWQRVVGGNFFYNHREQGGNNFHQVGFGIETLGNYLDWRMNGYVPLGDSYQVPNRGGGVTEAMFAGRNILVNFIADKPLAGLDTEIGGIIPGSLDIFRAYVGLYHFQGSQSDSFVGVQGRLEGRMRDSGVASIAITNDKTFGTNVVFGVGFWFPGFNPRNALPYNRAANRMGEDVVRNQNIVIERSPTREPVAARWHTGNIIDVVHVDSAAAIPGLGTPALPVQSLQIAQQIAAPESLIFVHANGQYNAETVVLQDGQQLLGEGIDHTISSLYGDFLLPYVTPLEDITNVPLISNAPGTTVTMANNTTVSGFRMTNSGGNGVFANGVNNVTVDRVNINGAALNAVQLLDVGGNIRVTENFLNNNGQKGLELSTSAAAQQNQIVVSDNTVLNNPLEGIDIRTNGQSQNTLVMERNLVRVTLGPLGSVARPANDPNVQIVVGPPLISINSFNSSQLAARVQNNDVEDFFLRDTNSPDEDPYYNQIQVTASDNSRIDIGFINNRLESNRSVLLGEPRNGSFGLEMSSNHVSAIRAQLIDNTSSLNFAFAENYISRFQLEDTLDTNTGTMFYFPTRNFFETIPVGSVFLP